MFILTAGQPEKQDILNPLRYGKLETKDDCNGKGSTYKVSPSTPKSYSFHNEFISLPKGAQLNFAKLMLGSALKGSGLTAEEIIDDPTIIEKELAATSTATQVLDNEYEKTKIVKVDKKMSSFQEYKATLNEYYRLDQSENVPLTLPQIEMKIKMFEALQEAGVQEIKLPEKAINQELSQIARALRKWEKQNEAQAKIISNMKRTLLDS